MDSESDESLYALLEACTPRVTDGQAHGTGFFVAPGLVLTCAHVVQAAHEARQQVTIGLAGESYPADIVGYHARPYPDLALLQVDVDEYVELADHPYVAVDSDVEPGDNLYTFGFFTPERRPEHYGGQAVTAVCEGPGYIDVLQTKQVLKFKEGNFVPGGSGGPLLNDRTWAVCGVVRATRDRISAMGGWGLPIGLAVDLFQFSGDGHPRWAAAADRHRRTHGLVIPPMAGMDIFVYRKPTNRRRPAVLLGRDDVVDRVNRALDGGSTVLVRGMPGTGKTAVAVTVA